MTDSALVEAAPTALTSTVTGQEVEYRPRVLHDFGIPELNEMSGGFGAGETIVVAAKTGAGKTAFGLHLARHHAEQGKNVLYVLKEMRPNDTVERLASADTGVPWDRIRYAKTRPLTVAEQVCVDASFAHWRGVLKTGGFKIWDRRKIEITPEAVVSQVRKIRNAKAVRETGADPIPYWDIVIIDYWGVLVPAGAKNALELAQTTASELEDAAEDSHCAVAILTQLGYEALGTIDAPVALKANLIQGATVLAQKAWRILFLDRAYGIENVDGRRRFKRIEFAAGFGEVKNRVYHSTTSRVSTTYFCGLYGDKARQALRRYRVVQDLRRRMVTLPASASQLKRSQRIADAAMRKHHVELRAKSL